MTAEELDRAREALAGVVAAVEAGQLAATADQLAHLHGSLAALAALTTR